MSSEKHKKSKYSKPKFLIAFLIAMGFFAGIRHAFSLDIPLHIHEHYEQEEMVDSLPDVEYIEDELPEIPMEETEANPMDSIPEDSASIYDSASTSDTDTLFADSNEENSNAHRVRGVWSYDACFPDIQDVQILAAKKNGIKPVKTRAEADKLVKSHKLVNIQHSPFYTVDNLTHSIPYLVPRAQHLVNTICLNFIDSCQVKNIPLCLPMISSVLRTTDDVTKLQRGNKNATTNSCHCYGTTVDIAYNRFVPVTGSYDSKGTLIRWDETRKQILSEVLDDLRRQGLCYVKYERRQGCFHLTVR